jgi:hypothetical protein
MKQTIRIRLNWTIEKDNRIALFELFVAILRRAGSGRTFTQIIESSLPCAIVTKPVGLRGF